MQLRLSGLLLLATLAVGASDGPIAAQQATITGRVTDTRDARPIEGVTVSADGRADVTDDQGEFRLSVSPGRHDVAFFRLDRQPLRRSVALAPGEAVSLNVSLVLSAIALEGIRLVADPRVPERTGDVPQLVHVIDRRELENRVTVTPVDHARDLAGVHIAENGIGKYNVVTRGFNNIFSGALLVLTDNRYTRVPSLRFNAYNMIPSTVLDIENVEVILGPSSALYGPNSANGVMHITTSSPIDRPGTMVSLTGGNRSILDGAFRQAFRFGDKAGLKVSGQYFRGDDFETRDPAEVPDPTRPLIGLRDFGSEKWSGEARFDLRPWDDSIDGMTLTYGQNRMVNSLELTPVGAAQARDWKYEFGQVQIRKSGFYGQAFLNRSHAGETYLLRTGVPLVDRSRVFVAQGQYAFGLTDRLDLVTGADLIRTTPITDGTINGANEDRDNTREIGGYLHARLDVSEHLDLIGAVRVDDHEHLEDPVLSPRLGVMLEPRQGHTFRGTFNRAFSTPTTNHLFLDLTVGQLPLGSGLSNRLQATGVPSTGYTWNDRCPGGIQSYCMYSPFLDGTQLPATGTAFWDAVAVPEASKDAGVQAALSAAGWTTEQFEAAVAGATPADVVSVLRRFNQEDLDNPFPADPRVEAVERVRPTITTSYEVGYQGLFGDRFKLTAAVYRNQIRDFLGPLRVETPSVFLDGASVGAFVANRLVTNGMSAAHAAAVAAEAAPVAAAIPMGTVAPDQRSNSDIVLTFRNFGDVSLWGTDLGLELDVTRALTLTGSYSWVSEECFDFDDDGSCANTADISLNAPSHKAAFGFHYDDVLSGFGFGSRVRYSDAFLMNSGVYVGAISAAVVVDASVTYRVPLYEGFIVSATVSNLFDNRHQELVGAPEIGRLALIRLQYAFGGR